jgi:hypothetical protein
MKLVKPVAYTDDRRYEVERSTYLAHCENISRILIAAATLKVPVREALIDMYLTTVNTEIEE